MSISTSELKESELTIYDSFDKMPIFSGKKGIKLLQGVISIAKFTKPSPIQQKAIVPLFNGEDVIAQAQSGSGKTGAFCLGTLSRIDHQFNQPQAIIIAHTHELAQQIAVVLEEFGTMLKIKAEVCIGGTCHVDQNIMNIQSGCHVLVGTPGRLKELIRKRAFHIKYIQTIILDEADKLLSTNFLDDMKYIMETVNNAKNREVDLQIGIFSATMPESIVDLARKITCDPIITLIPQEEISLDEIKQYKIEVEEEDVENSFEFKADLIIELSEAKMLSQCIIYVKDIKSAEALSRYLSKKGMDTTVIHGKIPPKSRHTITKDFRLGMIRILIATDLFARGIDSQHVMLVINFDLPRAIKSVREDGISRLIVDEERISEYIHRIGRSGRFGRKGVALNFVTNKREKTWMEKIEEFYEVKCEELPEDVADLF